MKKIEITFIVVIFCCLLFPIIRFHPNETVSQVENRNLAPKPATIIEGNLNKNLFAELNPYLQDHFGGRNVLITSANFIEYNILHKMRVNEKAFEGKNGWFFYISDNNLNDFRKKNLMNENQISDLRDNIKDVTKWCDENEIKYLFLICPNKHSIYPEKYIFPRPEGITRADQISKIFSELGIPYVYSRDHLISKKTEINIPLYYETGTHWNSLGAYYCFQDIFVKLQKLFNENLPIINYEFKINYNTNIDDMRHLLNIYDSQGINTNVIFTPCNVAEDELFQYDMFLGKDGRDGIKTVSKNQNLPKAIIFRDSFTSALVQYLSPLFSEAEYNWRQFREADKEYILQNKPDIIIFEAVERYSASIVAK